MKKKLIVAALAAAMVLAMTACGSNNTTPVTEVVSGSMELTELNKNGLDGLCNYLEGNGIVGGTALDMKADIIGAKEGKKFAFKYNDSAVIVELYQFDLDNLDEVGKETLDSVRNNGTFKVLDKDVEAQLSSSGKYMMIYTDTKDDDANIAQKQKAEKLVNEYDEQESTIKVNTTKKNDKTSSTASEATESNTSSSESSEAAK